MYQFEHLQESEEAYKEMDRLLHEYAQAKSSTDAYPNVSMDRDYSFLKHIHRVEDFVIRLAKSKDENFCSIEKFDPLYFLKCTPLASDLVSLVYHAPPDFLYRSFFYNRLSPYFDLFRIIIAKHMRIDSHLHVDMINFNPKDPGSHLFFEHQANTLLAEINGMLHELREAANRENFIKVVTASKKRATKNYKSLMNYFERLFRKHAELVVIRLDLGYPKEPKHHDHTELSLEGLPHQVSSDTSKFHDKLRRVIKHRKQLIKYLRQHYGRDLLGYAWKMEHGNYKGFHIHLVAILDGSRRAFDVTHGRAIGEHWKEKITGHGTYYNCNSDKSRYKFCGLGSLNYRDQELWQKIDKVASYMTKVDLYAHLYVTKRFVDRIRHQAADWGIDLPSDSRLDMSHLDAFEKTQPKPFKARIFGKGELPKDEREADSSDQTPRRGRPRHEDLVGWVDALGQKKKPPAKGAKAKSASDPALSAPLDPTP